jgi:predicted HTH transcriptional regulator
LAVKTERERLMVRLSELSTKIVQVVKDHGQLGISDIQAIIQANRNTIKVRLHELVDDGYRIMQGKGKGARYMPGKRLP